MQKGIDIYYLLCYNKPANADVAHLVERHLAKVEVASSSLVIRSKNRLNLRVQPIFYPSRRLGISPRRKACISSRSAKPTLYLITRQRAFPAA